MAEPGDDSLCAKPRPKKITADAILAVASDIPDMGALTKLMKELGFSFSDLMALDRQTFEKQSTAQRALFSWAADKGEKATGEVLGKALRKIGFTRVAEDHQDVLQSEFYHLCISTCCFNIQYAATWNFCQQKFSTFSKSY